jgi:hypothetical protein
MSNTDTKIVPAGTLSGDMMNSPQMFEHMQRLAKVFCASSLVPDHLKKNNGADALLALQIARERNENPVTVMQSIFFIGGKASWSSTYMIARANKSGTFKGPIRWRSEGAGDDLVVTAVALMADTGEEVSAAVSMKMAKAEGWTKNSKYNTMAEHMLRWRSATMLVRLYCPEVLIGMQTQDELEDMKAAGQLRDVTGDGHASTADAVGAILGAGAPQPAANADPEPPAEPVAVEGEILPPEPAAKDWSLPANIVGQDKKLAALYAMLDEKTETPADVDTLWEAHEAFFAKLGDLKQSEANHRFGDRKITLAQGEQLQAAE